jgi:glycosyltransferase involved in cell wall biosynthesis
MSVLRDPARAALRAAEAQEVVRLEFNWDTIAAQTIDIYRRVIEERKRIDW